MTTDTTPAVERAAEAIEREDRTSDLDGHALTRAMARAALTAALPTECHEAVVPDWADGEEQPCNAYAVAYREEVVGDAALGVYPVCEEHARPPLTPLTTAILGGAQ